jgi:hypothetical protein
MLSVTALFHLEGEGEHPWQQTTYVITYLSIVVIGFGLYMVTAAHVVALPQDMP